MSYSRGRVVHRRRTTVPLFLGALIVGIALLFAAAQSASALTATGEELTNMPVTEPFDGSDSSLTSFAANWSRLSWAAGTTPEGADTTAGWRPVSAYPTVNGAFCMQAVSDAGGGVAAAVTMAASPGIEQRHFSLWLDMPNPSAEKTGYELAFTYVTTNTYDVTLSRWQAGSQSILASRSSYTFANGHSLALVDKGSTVSAWTNTGFGFNELLSANDSALGDGYAGIAGAGNIARLANFRAGALDSAADELAGMPVTETFDGAADSRWNFAGKWHPVGWAGGWATKGAVTTAGWHPVLFYPIVNGAFYTPGFVAGGHAIAAAVTMAAEPGLAQRHFSLWLDMASLLGSREGYELRFTYVSANTYDVTLSRWQAGSQSVLASRSRYTFANGHSLALVDAGSTISAWTDSGSGFTQLLSASDMAFSGGNAGVDGSGRNARLTNFRAGVLQRESSGARAPDTSIESGPSGDVLPEEVSFAFTATDPEATFECSLDSAAYAACGSPQAYPSLPSGPHTFRVRAVDTFGEADETPAEQTFQVVQAPLAITAAADPVVAHEATLHGSVVPNGADTSYYFEYGTTSAYGSRIPVTASPLGVNAGTVSVSETLTGLAEDTTYHYRVVAENSVGTAHGQDRTFLTPKPPDVETGATAVVGPNEALVTGIVEPNGDATSYKIEYGTTTEYGLEAPGGWEGVGSGNEQAETEDAIPFLEPETTYHYRLVADNSVGTRYGQDRTFTTSASSVSPQREAEERDEEAHFTGKFTGALPDEFVDLMWSGSLPLTADPSHLEAIRRSGAKVLRLSIGTNPGGVIEWDLYDQIFERAANRGITILPQVAGVIPNGGEEESNFLTGLFEIVDRYGPGGSFWAGKASQLPPSWWEFGNEENYSCCGTVQPQAFGKLLETSADVMRVAADGDIHIVLGGLLSVSPPSSDAEAQRKRTPEEFLRRMGPYGRDDYVAVGLHPYVFKADDGNAPTAPVQVTQVANKIRSHISTLRNTMDSTAIGAGGKKIWITEIGWPTYNIWDPDNHPAVTQVVQRELIESTFEMAKANWQRFGIRNVFYYNIQDYDRDVMGNHPYNVNTDNWDYRSGLRGAPGNYKPGWYGFQEETGAPKWPVKPKSQTQGPAKKSAHRATLSAVVNPYGSPSSYRFKWGATTAYGKSTGWQSMGFEEGDRDVNRQITSLQNGQTYHYRAVAINENEEVEEGADMQFTTAPNTTTYISEPVETFNGNPGYVTVRGGVSSNEGTVYGKYVNVNFSKWENNEWVYKSTIDPHPVVDGGVYERRYWGVGKGRWRVRTVFPEQGELDQSESGYHEFEIRDGYQLVNTNSGKCLDIAYESPDNAAQAWLWECHSPVRNGQVFTLVPVSGSDNFKIVARNSGKCVDVRNDNQVAGEQLQQWACADPLPSVQIWRRFGGPNGWNFAIQHSGQCMDVWLSGTGNGNKIDQYPCNGTNAQGWQLRSVEGNPVPTSTTLSVTEVLNGEPGLVSVAGTLDVSGYPLTGKWVNVNFQKLEGGSWNLKQTLHLVEDHGHVEKKYEGLGPGSWRVRSVYPGEPPLAESSSPYQYFEVKRGYRLVNRVSGKCLSISEGSGGNGAKALQWDCSGNPQAGDGQLFTWFPMVNHWPYYQIRFNEPGGNNAGKCLDVSGVSQSDGVQLQLWDCLGEGQDNQLWRGEGAGGEYFRFRPKHSDKCMDDFLSGTNNGNAIVQWSCNGTDAQRWKWQAIK